MIARTATYLSAVALIAASTLPASGQSLPTSQPKFMTITREQVKVGRGAEHAKFETGYVAAFEKAKAPAYLALVSMTGPREVWYLNPFESHAAQGAENKRLEADPVLSAELDRLGKGDAEYLSDSRNIDLVARPDLSYGSFPDLSKVRFYEISFYRVRPGRGQEFADIAKSVVSAAAKAAPSANWRTYEVIAGLPEPTFLIFSSFESYGALDAAGTSTEAMMKSLSSADVKAMQAFFKDGLNNSETNRFRVDPLQSLVPKETREKDPAFWMPPPPKKPAPKS